MMIECEIKSGQTVESIEHTRREGDQIIGIKITGEIECSSVDVE